MVPLKTLSRQPLITELSLLASPLLTSFASLVYSGLIAVIKQLLSLPFLFADPISLAAEPLALFVSFHNQLLADRFSRASLSRCLCLVLSGVRTSYMPTDRYSFDTLVSSSGRNAAHSH